MSLNYLDSYDPPSLKHCANPTSPWRGSQSQTGPDVSKLLRSQSHSTATHAARVSRDGEGGRDGLAGRGGRAANYSARQAMSGLYRLPLVDQQPDGGGQAG